MAAIIREGWLVWPSLDLSSVATAAPGWHVALAEHGGPFVAGMERGRVIGCQFHPELSGDYGAALLSRFLELG